MMATRTGPPEPRGRSSSCSGEQRPQPKPRKRVAKSKSVRYTGNRVTGPGASASADSSPREIRSRSILQPTPLVQALTNQLMSSLNSEEEQREASGGTQKMDTDAKGVVNCLGSKSKHSPIIQRGRAHSEPKSSCTAPPRPTPPVRPPPPNPLLSRLISDNRATNNRVHVIDSRAKSKSPSPRHSARAATAKTTKYGTPPPTRPAPPPPKRIEKEKEGQRGNGPPKSPNSPVPKPRTLLPKPPGDLGNFNQDSSSTSKVLANAVTKEPVVDQSFPVYEDLDKVGDNDYERLDPSSSSSEDEREPIAPNTQSRLWPSATSDATPPPLPPKRGAKIELHNKEEESPPLPPRTCPVTTVRKHRLLTSPYKVPDVIDKRKDSEEEENEEAVQDTGVYEPVIYRGSDEESQKSQESYTEMNNPDMLSSDSDVDLENDKPEDIYITMDPHAYIPPPQNYKPKKKSGIFK